MNWFQGHFPPLTYRLDAAPKYPEPKLIAEPFIAEFV